MNEKRAALGLLEIDAHWALDSIEYLDMNDEYVINTYKVLGDSKLSTILKMKRQYYQYWSKSAKDTLKPYHHRKMIYYSQSFWLWENELIEECDVYINPKSKLEYLELNTCYAFQSQAWYRSVDTLKTKIRIQQDQKYQDSFGIWVCGLNRFDLEYDSLGLTKQETAKILKDWKLK